MNPLENPFPKDRKQIRKSWRDNIIHDIKSVDVDKIDYKGAIFKPRAEIKEKQKVFFWIRVYLNEEIDIKPETDITITYAETGEKLVAKFICYAKKGLNQDGGEEVVNYNPEDDKKVLCLMIDSERIDKNSDDIPFIRSLFKISRYYQPQVLRLADLPISLPDGTLLNYFDINF
jgi:hypothetical protein